MSAKVKESSLTHKLDIMRITTRDDAVRLKDVENGKEINMIAYVIQEITVDRGKEPTGEKFDSILVLDADGTLYATRSETFIEKVHQIMDELTDDESTVDFKENPLTLRITHQKARSGNMFVSCSLA